MSDQLRVGLVRVDQILFHPHNVRQDLGDLRALTNSIKKYGVMQPVVVEQYGRDLRLRAGHRRVAAARIAGIARVPAVIHAEALGDQDWIEQAIQENEQRRSLDQNERRRSVEALRKLGCTWDGIAETFGVTVSTVQRWCHDDAAKEPKRRKSIPGARQRAIERLIQRHRAEYREILAKERTQPLRRRDEYDEVVVLRVLDGESLDVTKAERVEIIRRWRESGKSLNELAHRHPDWNIWRDLKDGAAA